MELTGNYVIPDYNPEWVSIGVRYRDPTGGEKVYMVNPSTICHECVAEPSTFVLLICGAMGVLLRLWRRRS